VKNVKDKISDDKKWIIYVHINKINGKKYFGQTKTTIDKRAGKEGRLYCKCPYFYNAIQKYGWDGFEHIVLIDNIPSREIANAYEKYYIYLYNTTDSEYGYNLDDGGQTSTVCKIPVHKYDLNGMYIKSYDSITEASIENECQRSKISSCCIGNRKSCGGFMWSYKKEDCLKPYEKNDKSGTYVYQYDEDGNFIDSYISVESLKRILNIDFKSELAFDRDTLYHGYIWSTEFYEELEPLYYTSNSYVHMYDLSGNYIRWFRNSKEASFYLFNDEYKFFQIDKCCRGDCESAYGYLWRKGYKEKMFPYDKKKRKTNSKTVYMYDKEYNLIKIFNNTKLAAEYINCSVKVIWNLCNGATSQRDNFILSYFNENEILTKQYSKGYDLPKAVYHYDVDFNLIETFKDYTSAAKAIGCSRKSISRYCKNKVCTNIEFGFFSTEKITKDNRFFVNKKEGADRKSKSLPMRPQTVGNSRRRDKKDPIEACQGPRRPGDLASPFLFPRRHRPRKGSPSPRRGSPVAPAPRGRRRKAPLRQQRRLQFSSAA